MNRRSL